MKLDSNYYKDIKLKYRRLKCKKIEKTRDSPKIHDNFFFNLRVYFIYFQSLN